MKSFGFDLAIAWRNVLRQWRRSATAVFAVGFGVMALVLVGGFIDWLLHAMREWTIRSQFGHFQVTVTGYREHGIASPFQYLLPEPSDLLVLIEQSAGVTGVAPRLSFNGLISHGDATLSFIGQGMQPARERHLSSALQITQGADLSEDDEHAIVIGQGLARNLGVNIGESVVLLVTDSTGGVNAVECRIRGLFATASKTFDDVAVRAPLSTARKLMKVGGSHAWVVFLDHTDLTDRVLETMGRTLSSKRLEFTSWSELADMFNKTATLFGRQIGVLKVIVAAIIVLSISNTMMMNVVERTGEIGTAMAIGVRRRALLRLFLLEGLLLGLLGGIAGLLLGLATAWLASAVGIPMPPPPGMERGYTAEIMLSLSLTRDALLISLATALIATLYPAWKASRMAIVDSLRHSR